MGKAEILEKAEDNKKLVIFKDVQPIALLESPDLDQVLADIKREVQSEINDVDTEDGRKNIKSLVSKISKSLRFVENKALDHARELKAAPKIFDGKRKIFKDFMSALKDNTERPLIEYEKAKEQHSLMIANKVMALRITGIDGVLFDGVETLEGAKAWKDTALNTVIDESFEDSQEAAERFRKESLMIVDGLIAKYEKEVQEAAEAEKARLEQEAKAKAEYEAKVEREAQERAEKAAQQAIEAEKAKAEQVKIDAEKREKEAEAQAIIDKENAVKAEAARVQQIADDKAAEERAKVKAELDRKAAIAAQERKEQEAAKRKSEGKRHQSKINLAAAQAIRDKSMAWDTGERAISLDEAKLIVSMIVKGEIPHVTINY